MNLPISPGAWLFATCVIYFIVGMTNLFVYKFTDAEYIQLVWLYFTAMPLFISMRKIVSINPIWRM